MEKILNDLKNSNKYFWFIPKGKRIALIAQGKSKKEVKEKFNNKIEKLSNTESKIHKHKYYNTDIITAEIKIVKKIDTLEPGHIGIVIKFKKINDKGSIKNIDDERSNIIWFTEKYLLKKGFSGDDISKLLTGVYFNKIKLSKLGINLNTDFRY